MTKITNKDLIGDLKGFPIEIAQRMLECTEEQGAYGIKELQKCLRCTFLWAETKEGLYFWREIVWYKNFDLFYGEYPKKHSSLTTICVRLRKGFKLIVK